jgi:ubiquinone/menaquinone biosynthesis C-methylase UbiE
MKAYELAATIAALPPAKTLDVACGTGFLTQHLRGRVVGLDQSDSMLEIARRRLPQDTFVQGDAPPFSFPDGSFERVFTSFYGHLAHDDRLAFLREARRVAGELVVVDSALNEDHEPTEWQDRVLLDGSTRRVYKRFFTGTGLAEELGGGETLYQSRGLVAVRS